LQLYKNILLSIVSMGGDFTVGAASALVFPCVALGIGWGLYNYILVNNVKLIGGFKVESNSDDETVKHQLNTSAGSEEKMA
jgi:hypothetical protein